MTPVIHLPTEWNSYVPGLGGGWCYREDLR